MDPQDLTSTVYVSSRYGARDVSALATPHAMRALDALRSEHGARSVDKTPLGRALAERAALMGAEPDRRAIPFGDPAGAMLRGAGGRFAGAIHPAGYVKRRPLRAGEFTRSPSGRMMTEQTNELLPPSGRTRRGCRS
jgi:hypothetical protein